MWDTIKSWFSGVGEFMFLFLKTAISDMVAEVGPAVLKIVRQVEAECAGGCSGQEKFDKAIALAIQQLPGIAINAIRIAIETAVAIMNEESCTEDRDGDGVVDCEDRCPDVGDQGCGVDENGCPIPCD